jgi:uncharacterized protein (DUF433 family)
MMPKTLTLEPRSVPLTLDEHGVWRVTGTTIPLERVIECYQAGLSPEATVESFDSLRLADVYAIVSYYLDNKAEVQEYLRLREEKAEEIQRMIEAGQPPRPGLREELLARWAQLREDNAQAGQ